MGQPLGRIIKQTRTFYIATMNRVGGKQQLSSFCFPEDERQSKLFKLETVGIRYSLFDIRTSTFELRYSTFEPRNSSFALRYSKFDPRTSNFEPRNIKGVLRNILQRTPLFLKTAATYSPTGVQYHRRGRA